MIKKPKSTELTSRSHDSGHETGIISQKINKNKLHNLILINSMLNNKIAKIYFVKMEHIFCRLALVNAVAYPLNLLL